MGRYKFALRDNVVRSIEPVMFMHAVSALLVSTVYSSLRLDKVCRVGSDWFGNGTSYSDELCDEIDNGDHEDEQDYVQQTANKLSAAETYLLQVPSFIFILMAGAWSDRYGRKLIVFLPVFGMLLSNIYVILNVVFYDQMSADWLLFTSLSGLTGEIRGFYVGIYSFATDVSSSKNRISRLILNDFAYSIGKIVGSELSGVVYDAWGYIGPFSLSALGHVLQIVYLYIVLVEPKKEERPADEKLTGESSINPLKKMYDLLKDTLLLMTRPRKGYLRICILLTVAAFLCYTVGASPYQLEVTYLRKVFSWEDGDEFNDWYATFTANSGFLTLPSSLLVILLSQVFKISDTVLLGLAALSSMAEYSVWISVERTELLYLAVAAGMLARTGNSACRSSLSKMAGEDEAGRAMATVGVAQAVGGFFGPLFDFVYNATLTWHAGFVYCLASLLDCISATLTLGVVHPLMIRQEKF